MRPLYYLEIRGWRRFVGVFRTLDRAKAAALAALPALRAEPLEPVTWRNETWRVIGYYGDVPADVEPDDLFTIYPVEPDRAYKRFPYE